MPLSRVQLANLRIYQLFRTESITVAGLVWANRRIYLIILSINLLTVLAISRIAGPVPGSIFGSFVMGALLRDLSFFRRTVKIWPVLKQIIDWKTVDQLIVENDAKMKSHHAKQDEPQA